MDEMNEMTTVAMKIILSAGDARNYNFEALDCYIEGQYEKGAQLITKAKASIQEAHSAQTEFIQREASGVRYQPTLLFIHAQDTLMTINSELMLTNKIIKYIESRK